MKKPQREPSDTRQLIVACAAEQFALWGYTGASVGDIAAAVGVSKPTLYHHFSDKEQIYAEIVTNVLTEMTSEVTQAVAAQPSASAPERLRIFMRAHSKYLQENVSAYIAAQLGFRGLRSERDRDEALRLRDGYEAILAQILKDGRRKGTLAVTDVRLATFMVLSTLNWMARWYRPDGKRQATEIAECYFQMLLGGFEPREGKVTIKDASGGKRTRAK